MASNNRAQILFIKGNKALNLLAQGSAAIAVVNKITSLTLNAAKESYLGRVLWHNDYFYIWHGSLLHKAGKLCAARAQAMASLIAKPLRTSLEHSFLFQGALSIQAAGKRLVFPLAEKMVHSHFYRLGFWLFNLDEQER